MKIYTDEYFSPLFYSMSISYCLMLFFHYHFAYYQIVLKLQRIVLNLNDRCLQFTLAKPIDIKAYPFGEVVWSQSLSLFFVLKFNG